MEANVKLTNLILYDVIDAMCLEVTVSQYDSTKYLVYDQAAIPRKSVATLNTFSDLGVKLLIAFQTISNQYM